MKTIIFLALFVCAALAISHPEAVQKFVAFQHKYQKVYAHDEFQNRFRIFRKNLEKAEQLQKKETGTATYGVTKFSDLSDEEFRTYYLLPKGMLTKDKLPKGTVASFEVKPPTQGNSFDWNTKGAITPVYDQGQCGSCWAFSATETIESYWFLAGNQLTGLAMQQIVDCDTTDQGCNGGWTYQAYAYVESAGGIEPLSDYPYTAEDGTCQFNGGDVLAKISGWQYVTQSQDENAMLSWVTNSGPLSVCVDASTWSSYTGGVVSSCGDSLDHCVQLTGYSNVQGTDAWNVRNSWGSGWGESGYIYLARGSNVCGVAEVVTVVTA